MWVIMVEYVLGLLGNFSWRFMRSKVNIQTLMIVSTTIIQ